MRRSFASVALLVAVLGPSRLFRAPVLIILLFSSQLAQAQFTQQGPKLVGSFTYVPQSNPGQQGWSVALSGNGNTAIVGGPTQVPPVGLPYSAYGAAWVFTRSGGVWTQQGSILEANDASDPKNGILQGRSVALSADGNTAIVGGPDDGGFPSPLPATGAAWVYTRSGVVWTQQGPKLVGTGAVGIGGPAQGWSVALSADGNTAIVGGPSRASHPN
jgi:hypothetical protein